MGDEMAMQAVALTQNILEGVARFVENPAAFSIEDFRRLNAKIMAANKLVAQALVGQGQQPPLRTLQGDAGEEEESGDEQNLDEDPANLDQDDLDEDDSSGARFPSEIQPRPPSGKRPRKRRAAKEEVEELRKSAGAVLTFQTEERLQGMDSADDFVNAILPIRRRTKDSAIRQTAGGY
jgi:hypothetical protein